MSSTPLRRLAGPSPWACWRRANALTTGDVQAAKSIKSQNDKDEDHHADRDDYEEAADATGCGSGAEKGGHDNDDGGGEPRAMATSIASSGKQEWGKQKQMQQQQQLIAGGVRGVEASSSLSLSLVGELSSSSATLTSSGPPVVASKRDGKAPARTEGRFNGWHGTEGTGEPDDTMVAEPGAAYVSSVLNLVDMKGKALLAMEQRGVLRTNCIDCSRPHQCCAVYRRCARAWSSTRNYGCDEFGHTRE